MIKSKIDWCDSTWSPVTGCLHGCEYCYARGIAKRFGGFTEVFNGEMRTVHDDFFTDGSSVRELDKPRYILENAKMKKAAYPYDFVPTLHRYRMGEYQKKQKPRNIFVCSMADLFGEWVPTEWIIEVFNACRKAPQHNYLFLTKNPVRYIELYHDGELPLEKNFWYGTTVTDGDTPFMTTSFANTFVSAEPILKDFGELDANGGEMPDWLILGAETGRRKDKVVPEKAWIDRIVKQCKEKNIPVFMKESLRAIYGNDLIREFPEGLQHG